MSSPAILVGHSYGGTIITAAGIQTSALSGWSISARSRRMPTRRRKAQQDKFPRTDVFGHIEVADGRVWLKPSGIACFAGDLPEKEQKLVWATQGVPAADLFNEKLEGTAWRSKPSWYIVGKNDRDTLFNKRDYAAAEKYWSPDYIQHSAHIEPGRDGLFNLIRSAPDTLRYEHQLIVAEGDYVIVHGRFSGNGRPVAWIAADIVRIENGRLAEHWDVSAR